MSAPVLEVKNVTMRFGGLKALSEFNLTMEPGELVGPDATRPRPTTSPCLQRDRRVTRVALAGAP